MIGDNPIDSDATEFAGSPSAAADAASLAQGARLGDYIIRRSLGEGGMGRVYLAEQTAPVRREVALKLIREQVAGPMALAWFEVERQALAQMQHPAIAQIYDAGTTAEGHAYLAMELVEGAPVTRYCRERDLAIDSRLALFVRICQGVQHAHQKGVIHRDLKPGNVLVRDIDATPAPKIIDFGIAIGGVAGATGTASAVTSDRAGTAIYMSPEQAEGDGRDIDTRSDVYSLGVMLFEVLTGSEAAGLMSSSMYQSRGGKTIPLRDTLFGSGADVATPDARDLLDAARALAPELRAILRRALAEQRDERYDSAAALAEDLQRFRENRPVLAMPATRGYALRKFAARHRLGIAAGVFALIALLVGAGLALQGQQRAEAAARHAQVEAIKAGRIADFVQQMLGGIDPDRARGMDRQLMRLILDSAAQRAPTELAEQPDVRAQIERIVAQSYAAIGEYALAAAHFDTAHEMAAGTGIAAGERLRMLVGRVDSIGNQGRFDEAVGLVDSVLAEASALAPHDRDRLFAESRMAWAERGAGKLQASIVRYESVLARQRETLGAGDPDTLESARGLAASYTRVDRHADAEPLLQDTLDRNRASHGELSTKTLDSTVALAVMYLESERYAEAETLLTPALPLAETLLGKDHSNTLVLVSNLGSAIRNQGRNAEARPLYERTFETNLRLHGPDHYLTVSGQSNLARLLRDLGELEIAEQHARTAIAHMGKAFGPENPARAIFIHALAKVLISQKRHVEARTELDRAYVILEAHPGFGPNHSRTRDVISDYVTVFTGLGDTASAALWRARLEPKPAPKAR